MDVLPSGNLFRELQDVTDTGYFEWKLSLEDYWQQPKPTMFLTSVGNSVMAQKFTQNSNPLVPQFVAERCTSAAIYYYGTCLRHD
ncbi:unnamed protein product, partial [Iphiclides podalirius]